MKTTITSTSNPPMVELRLSNAPVESEVTGDVIADLNRKGNWIRGLEVLGANQFSLQKALASLSPEASAASVQQPQNKLTVTYDKDADAGFLYLPYPDSVQRASQGDPLLLKCSYSVEDESAVFGLDGDGALVFVRFKVPAGEQLDSFMELFGSQA